MRKLICSLFFLFWVLGCTAQSWQNVGGGVSGNVFATGVITFSEYNGKLIAGGGFTSAGGIHANNIAQWDGVKWDSVGSGILDTAILTTTVYDSILYAGGHIAYANGQTLRDIAQWNSVAWDTVGQGITTGIGWGTEVLIPYKGELFAGGLFISTCQDSFITRWNGVKWSSVGVGINNEVAAFAIYNGELYVGGLFTKAGGLPVNFIARWDGNKWDSVGAGMNNAVYELYVYNGCLYAGGEFTMAGRKPANCIAKWDGAKWSALGSGISGASPFVCSLCSYNNQLIAGGIFTTAGGSPANQIASWNGSNWAPMGAGLNGYIARGVATLCVYDSVLYAGGDFDSSGNAPINYIAQWCPTCPTGINEIITSNGNVEVYPNPSNGVFTFQMQGIYQKAQIEIYNILGQQVYATPLNLPQGGDFKMDLTNQPSGIYLYRITSDKGELIGSGKLIVQ